MSSPEEPFHEYPEPKFELLTSLVGLLSFVGLIAFAILHFQSEPDLRVRPRNGAGPRSTLLRQLLPICVFYFLPWVLIFTASVSGAEDAHSAVGLVVAAIVVEVALNIYLFFIKNNKERIYPRLARRTLFVSMCVLMGASFLTDQYNDIDYYGPVRVTEVDLAMVRPEQKIDIGNPTYYYYYRLKEKIEWGSSWACPKNSDLWCSANEDLYEDECKKRIDCNGWPKDHDGEVGECATPKQRADAKTELIHCWAQMARSEGIQPGGFASANFTKTVAPWEDPLQPHTVTRAVSCGADCSSQTSIPPQDMAHEAFLGWFSEFVLFLGGCILFVVGIWKGQEQQNPRPAQRFEPVGSELRDLELASSHNGIPIAHAMPMT